MIGATNLALHLAISPFYRRTEWGPVEIRAVTTPAEFVGLQAEWEGLLAQARTANIFLTFDWLHTWWRHYGGKAQLYILAAYEGNELAGLIPLMIEERRLAGLPVFRRLVFLGTGISDRLDVLLTPGAERGILEAAISHLAKKRWDMVDLQEVLEDSVTVKLLPELAGAFGLRVDVKPQSICPVIQLPKDPEVYVASLSKKLRGKPAKHDRRLGRYHAVALHILDGGPRLFDELQAFSRVYRKCFAGRPSAAPLLGEKFAGFRQEVATRLARQGHRLLALLRVNGAEVAGNLCFQYGGSCYSYNLCHDPAWVRQSVGTILQFKVIRHPIALGNREFDYLRGDEEYKFRWGARPRRHVRIRMTRQTAKVRLLQTAMRLARSRPSFKATKWVRSRLLHLWAARMRGTERRISGR